MEFEWDDGKACLNASKHGVSFELAALAFGDEFALVFEDDRRDYGEIREILVGRPSTSHAQCLVVVFTEKWNGRVRLISARRATRREARWYSEQRH